MSGTLDETADNPEPSNSGVEYTWAGEQGDFVGLLLEIEAAKAFDDSIDNAVNNSSDPENISSDQDSSNIDSPPQSETATLDAVEKACETFWQSGEEDVVWGDFVDYTVSHPIIVEDGNVTDGGHSTYAHSDE